MFIKTPNRTMTDNLLWKVLPNLKKAVPTNNSGKDDNNEDKNAIAPGTDWDEIGLLSDLVDSNSNTEGSDAMTKDVG